MTKTTARPTTTMRRLAPWALCASLLLLGPSFPAGAVNPAWPDKTATPAQLEDPATWPDDPGYGFDPNDPTKAKGQWNLWSFTPPGVAPNLTPAEAAAGVGMSADRAWQLTTGNPRVVIAILDSGFHWGEADLVNKWQLNPGELPIPEGATKHDANGDGVFNVQDYTSATGHEQPTADKITDSRVRDVNGNGILDPEDLILIFSDGKDDDGDGYVDDICGWDFFRDDNDPYDDAGNGGQGYSHGTGEARDSAAEGNNGIGGIGACPGCMILPLRASDSFVADADHFAEATVYAVDRGASVVQEALGSVNATPFMQRAIDYAYDHGVLVVASSADERSYHHNFPAGAEKTLSVGAIVYDRSPWTSATTFENFNNCTNYGGHQAVMAPGEACSSEATGMTGGMAGLVYSMALDSGLDPPLSANEAYQVITESADDIDVPGSATDPTKFESGPGWDWHFGYGRTDAYKAVKMVADGRIPPEALISKPRWFETVTPDQTLVVSGHADARRATGGFSYKIEIAPGVEPRAGDWTVVTEKTGLTGPVDGELAKVDLSAFSGFQGPSEDPQHFAATLRLTVTATGPDGNPISGEYRKAFFVHRDTTLVPGFPIYLGASGESSPRLADLNGDGKDEIVIGLSDGTVHAFEASGRELDGWPVKVPRIPAVVGHPDAADLQTVSADARQPIMGPVSVGDLDGDGKPEVVADTLNGVVDAWHASGQEVSGFPVKIDPANDAWTGTRPDPASTPQKPIEDVHVLDEGVVAAPVLADLDGNGTLEIVVAAMDGYLYVWNDDGTPHKGFPVEITDPAGGYDGSTLEKMRARIVSTPAVGDVDGDGKPDIVLGSNEAYGSAIGEAARAYAIHGDGNDHAGGAILAGWPVDLCCYASILPYIGRGAPASPVLYDVDGRPGEEAILHGSAGPFVVVGGDGVTQLTGRTSGFGANTNSKGKVALSGLSSGILVDLDGDGFPEYVDSAISQGALTGMAGGVRHDYDLLLGGWSLDGVGPFLDAWPRVIDDLQLFNSDAAGDVDGDGRPEVIAGSGGYLLHAFNIDGQEAAGFPKHTGGWIMAAPALGDLLGDGALDVVVPTRDGWLWAWRTTGQVSSIQWAGFHHDNQSTGDYSHPLEDHSLQPNPGGAGGTKAGCGCSAQRGGVGDAWLFVLAILGFALRRRLA